MPTCTKEKTYNEYQNSVCEVIYSSVTEMKNNLKNVYGTNYACVKNGSNYDYYKCQK